MPSLLSKSTFIRSIQCLKSLYLYRNYYHLRDEISFERQAIFDRGHRVGLLAQSLFPGGEDAAWDSPKAFRESVAKTQQFMADGAEVIYEAAFLWNEVLVAADIVVKEGGKWHIYEVKSSLGITETYLRDAAMQLYIITKSGLPVSGISIIHPNREYIREEVFEPEKYFMTENITAAAEERIPAVIQGLITARRTLENGIMPEISIGPHCDIPYSCDFKVYCGWNRLPQNSIFELHELEEERKWELYNQRIIHIKDIPAEYEFSAYQRIEWHTKTSGDVYINTDALKEWFGGIAEPVAFLDIQKFMPAIPEVAGTHPYTSVPFGFALKSGHETIKDHFYLSNPALHLDKAFAEELLKATENAVRLIVFDKKRELHGLNLIAGRYPEMAEHIRTLTGKIQDISDVFYKKMFWHPDFKGYITLQELPAVFGHNSPLEGQQIGSDSHAGTAFEYLFQDSDLFKHDEVREMLEDYITGSVNIVEMVYAALKDSVM